MNVNNTENFHDDWIMKNYWIGLNKKRKKERRIKKKNKKDSDNHNRWYADGVSPNKVRFWQSQ